MPVTNPNEVNLYTEKTPSNNIENPVYLGFLENFKKALSDLKGIAESLKELIGNNYITDPEGIIDIDTSTEEVWSIDEVKRILSGLKKLIDETEEYIKSVDESLIPEDEFSSWLNEANKLVFSLRQMYNNVKKARLSSIISYDGINDSGNEDLQTFHYLDMITREKTRIPASGLDNEDFEQRIRDIYESTINLLIAMIDKYDEKYFDRNEPLTFCGNGYIESYDMLEKARVRLENLKGKKCPREIGIGNLRIFFWKVQKNAQKYLAGIFKNKII